MATARTLVPFSTFGLPGPRVTADARSLYEHKVRAIYMSRLTQDCRSEEIQKAHKTHNYTCKMGLQRSNPCPIAEPTAMRSLLLKKSVVFTVHTSV